MVIAISDTDTTLFPMDLGLENRVILVSGGASGIGAAIVDQLKAENAQPVILDLSEPADSQQNFFTVDLCNDSDVTDAIHKIRERFGSIDGIINNAGLNDSVGLDSTREKFRVSLERNLVQCYGLVSTCLDDLKKTRGSIVNVGSKVADTGQGGTSGYAASKGGLNALTREWALDLAADGIRCNAVIPAEVWTPMYEKWLSSQADPESRKAEIESRIPLGPRMTTASEIAAMAVFLLSDRSAHTTGQIIHVDGGYTHLDRAYRG